MMVYSLYMNRFLYQKLFLWLWSFFASLQLSPALIYAHFFFLLFPTLLPLHQNRWKDEIHTIHTELTISIQQHTAVYMFLIRYKIYGCQFSIIMFPPEKLFSPPRQIYQLKSEQFCLRQAGLFFHTTLYGYLLQTWICVQNKTDIGSLLVEESWRQTKSEHKIYLNKISGLWKWALHDTLFSSPFSLHLSKCCSSAVLLLWWSGYFLFFQHIHTQQAVKRQARRPSRLTDR